MTHGRTNISVPSTYVKPDKPYLYNYGDECVKVSGGWSWVHQSSYTAGSGSKEADHLRLYELTDSYGSTVFGCLNLIDMSEYNKLYAEISVTTAVASNSSYPVITGITITTQPNRGSGTYDNNYTEVAEGLIKLQSNQLLNKEIIEVDISNLNEGAVWFYMNCGNWRHDQIDTQCYRIWLE